MDTEGEIKKIILKHISPKDYAVFLFGSRVDKRHGKWSDYDVGVLGKRGQRLPTDKKISIESELENSNIPYFVEIVDFAKVPDKFKKIALRKVKSWT